MMWASSVSAPDFLGPEAETCLFWLMVPAKTLASLCLDTATGSPLSMLSST